MVNFNNPVALVREGRAYASLSVSGACTSTHLDQMVGLSIEAFVKLWHFVDGVFVWEFLTTLDYEWDVYHGKRPYGWSIWVYSLTRLSTLMAVILNIVDFDVTVPMNCQLWVKLEISFFYLAFATSSLLIVLRVFAIWNRNKIVLAISTSIWVADIVLLIRGVLRIRSTWLPSTNTCGVPNFESTLLSFLAILFTDIVLLLIMLIGLIRMRIRGAGSLNLARFLWNQGLIWFIVATVAEVPSAVFMILNLNVPLDLIPQTPCMISVTIASTWIYRSLMNHCASEIPHETPGSGRPMSEVRIHPEPRTPVNRMEVSVRTERDQFPKSRSPCVSTRQSYYKTREKSLDSDVECGPLAEKS